MILRSNFYRYKDMIKRVKYIDVEGQTKVDFLSNLKCPKCGNKWVFVILGSMHLYVKCKLCNKIYDLGIIVEAYTD